MKGVILAGGSGTRLKPLTKVTSKQLLPVYDHPMIYYPLQTLVRAGIKEILIITAPEHAGDYLNYLGSGRDFGVRFTYEIQDTPGGLPQAFIIGETFIDSDDVALILGDNIFEDDFSSAIESFHRGAHIFAKEVPDPQRFGVVKFDASNRVIEIQEKPKEFLSPYAITGLYLYDARVVDITKNLQPSERGELEIVDLHRWYLERSELTIDIVHGEWIDAGTFDTLLKASNFIAKARASGANP